LSGPAISEKVPLMDGEVICTKIVPDDRKAISEALIDMSDNIGADLILTTGGTGLSPRDITPEATTDAVDKMVPGIPEEMRRRSMEKTPYAMISRAVAGIRRKTLIINLPGSPKAAAECLDAIISIIPHAICVLKGNVSDCREDINKCRHEETGGLK
jgi:molybdenum cofactor synthesis domain-containing protein